VLGILALASWLRLRGLDLAEFKPDEAIAVHHARQILDGDLTTVGLISSVGAANPPLFLYLAAIPLAVRDDPLAATAFVSLLAVAATGLTYAVLRPRFGAFAACAAMALFASAPWAVLYGRKLWAQDLLPVFTVPLLWSLFVVLERPRSRAVLLVPVLLCAALQLHFSALALTVPAVAMLLYRRREVHWPALAAGAAVAVLLLAPWLRHELTNGFDDVGRLASEGRGSGSTIPGAGSVEAVRETTRIAGDAGWDFVLGTSRALFVDDAGSAWTLGRWAAQVGTALLALGLLTSVVRVARGARRCRRAPWFELDVEGGRRALLLVWLAGVWLSYAASGADRVKPHYLIVTYPVSFAVQALGLADVAGAASRRFRHAAGLAAIAIVGLVVTGYMAFTLAFQDFLDDQGGTAGDYGVVYRDKEALARVARERGLHVADEPVLEFLVSGDLQPPTGTTPLVTVRDRLQNADPLPCDGELRLFGALAACLPPSGDDTRGP
jgi:Dolichyl-phosphate-mannose-protein mannosyltransferase